MPSVLEVRSPNHWTTRGGPYDILFNKLVNVNYVSLSFERCSTTGRSEADTTT